MNLELVSTICCIGSVATVFINLGLLFMQLKMYTEYFKDRSQQGRSQKKVES